MWAGNFPAQESKAGISCTDLRQRPSNCSRISGWHPRQSSLSPWLQKCCAAPCHRQGDARQNKLNHSLPPFSTRTRLCSTSLDEILIQPVRERYPQPSIRDLSVLTPLWRITFALSPAGKALVFLFPPPFSELPWLEHQTFQSYNDLLKPVLLSKSSGKQKLC